jgi:hypothetical protein
MGMDAKKLELREAILAPTNQPDLEHELKIVNVQSLNSWIRLS